MDGKRIISFLLALVMVFGILPVELGFGQEETNIEEIQIYRTYESLSDKGTYTILIYGSGLRGRSVAYRPTGGDIFIPLGQPLPGSHEGFLQFRVDPDVVISEIMVGNERFIINETDMPKVTKVDPVQVNLSGNNPSVTLEGTNFDKVDDKTTIEISNVFVTEEFKGQGKGRVTLDKSWLQRLQNGIKHIVISRKDTQKGVDITVTYNQRNSFRVYESIDIDRDYVTIYPNRGKVGTEVTITIDGTQENFSVFFLRDEYDEFLYNNMGEEARYRQTEDGRQIIRVRVPKNLSPGETYRVMLTNNLDPVKEPNRDLTEFVTKQQNVGNFYVVEADVGPVIDGVDPTEGTSSGSYVTIYGYRFEELDISGLIGETPQVTQDHLEVVGGDGNPTKLRIKYDSNNFKYNGKNVTSITRDFLVTIGRDTVFVDDKDHLSQNIFRLGEEREDQLYVRTRTIEGEDLDDPVKDVVIEITTTIETREGSYEFTEVAVLPKGYTFLPSHQAPLVEKAVPDKIQVVNETNPETKNNTILSIQGEGFNVFRYRKDGQYMTNYPDVILGGNNERTGLIKVSRGSNGEVKYYTKGEDGSWVKASIQGKGLFEVLDRNGSLVTGVGGNEVGNTIVIKIPKGLNLPANNLNKPLPVAVANPLRDSEEKGRYSYEIDLISFVTDTNNPIIEEVEPYIVTVDGGETIIVRGRNFDPDIRVFIDGREIENVTRDIDRQTTRGTLEFTAPRGREGTTILQVMNPGGGSDTHEFIYVQTMRIDPSISSIAPAKGTKDTLVVIKGNNFLKPDQTVTEIDGLGIYKLIGSRVLLGGVDVNVYHPDRLGKYTSPNTEGEKLLKLEADPWTNRIELVLSPYYKSAIVKDGAGRPYSVYVDYEGNPVVSGEDKIYTFQLMGEDIKAVDQASQYYDVEVGDTGLTLTNGEGEEVSLSVDFDYSLFSTVENEFGTKELRVADYFDSLILKEGAGEGDSFYTIEVDGIGRVTLSDGRNNVYEIKLDRDTIYATRASEKYQVEVGNASIKLVDGESLHKELHFHTPYYVDPITGAITGHRAKVKNKNEIWVTIPEKSIPGFYNVTVRNPDTKSDTVKNGFEYLIPQSRPKINYISPSQGSVEGGYEITIYGEGFQDTTEVYLAGVKISEENTKVNKQDYKSITIMVPPYPGDIEEDFITDKKSVPVVVVNEDGGSAAREDLFSYVIASSRPRIDRVNPVTGSAAGGDIIEIWGYDFRYFEPYKGDIPKEGDSNYEDIDRNGRWTNMRTERDCDEEWMRPIDHPLYHAYCASPVLPKVFFASEQAKIVEFRDGYMKVIAPRFPIQGTVDVYVVNNDAGTSNKVKFTFEGSNPRINSIVPGTGKRQGGERVDIQGENFRTNRINLINEKGEERVESSYLVRFGGITNRNIPREDENSGRIDSGRAAVNLAGGLRVEYKITTEPTIEIVLEEGKKVYRGEYSYSHGAKYINLKGLETKDGEKYPGFELLKVEINDGRLLVDRGYSPEVKLNFRDHLEVVTPSYYTVGHVSVVVENPDGVSNSIGFEYKNPDSRPRITNITRDGNDPILGDDGNIRVVPVHYQGGSIIGVIGSDFRENALIQIGDILTINPKDIDYTLPYKMTFTMPGVSESALGRLHKLVVINEDGGTASSDSLVPPIYIQFIKGESNPSIESITPDRGPSKGGTKVVIRGNDFRETMEGFEGEELKVYFGDSPVPSKDIKVIDYKTIEVITPPGSPGRVEVKVENPDGSLARPSGYFTYISGPEINRVEDGVTGERLDYISVKGGQELRLKGQEFMPNARVVFAPKLREAERADTGDIIYIDGRTYVLESGRQASGFKFIDEETVEIITPQGQLGEEGVIIINPDGGASPVYPIVYGLPELDAPEGVVAELVFEKYIRVHWEEVPGADYYEIYEVEGRNREEFIGSTELTSFLYKDIKPNSRYRFIVKAVGEFGSSKPSRTSNFVRTGRYAGYEDEDGALGEKTTINRVGDRVNVNLGSKDFYSTRLNLQAPEYRGVKKVVVSMPLSLVYSGDSYRQLTIIGEDFNLNFSPYVFRNLSYKSYRNEKDAGIRFTISYHNGNTNLNGQTSLSNQILLEGEFYKGKDVERIDYLSSGMELELIYDRNKAELRKVRGKYLYYFDERSSQWIQVPSGETFYYTIRGSINRLGRYTILGHRR